MQQSRVVHASGSPEVQVSEEVLLLAVQHGFSLTVEWPAGDCLAVGSRGIYDCAEHPSPLSGGSPGTALVDTAGGVFVWPGQLWKGPVQVQSVSVPTRPSVPPATYDSYGCPCQQTYACSLPNLSGSLPTGTSPRVCLYCTDRLGQSRTNFPKATAVGPWLPLSTW